MRAGRAGRRLRAGRPPAALPPGQVPGGHIADKNGAVVDILSKYPSGHSHSQLQLQIYLEKMVLTKQTDVLLSRRACVETTAVARFFTTECEISGRVVTVFQEGEIVYLEAYG